MTPNILQEAIVYFSDFENCQRTMIELRWSDGKVRYPYCQSDKVAYLPSGKVWRCASKHARRKFFAQGWNHLRGFTHRPRQIVLRPVARRELQERRQFMRFTERSE